MTVGSSLAAVGSLGIVVIIISPEKANVILPDDTCHVRSHRPYALYVLQEEEGVGVGRRYVREDEGACV